MASGKVRKVDLVADEFLAAVVGEMTAAELGVYWMICLLHYNRRKPIPYDLDWLRGKFKSNKGNRAIAGIVEGLIKSGRVYRDGDEIGVRRCRDEVESATRRIRDAAESGSRGGRPRNKNNEIGKGVVFRNEKGPEKLSPSPSPAGSSDTDVSYEPTKKRALTRAQSFEAWWLGYPHKVGKGEAQAKFDIAFRGGTSLDELNAGVDRYKRDKPDDRGWMNPSTWLFQKRWLDDPAPTLVADNTGPAAPLPEFSPHELFRARLTHLRDKGRWYPEKWGPHPDDAGCQAPHDLLVEYGFRERAA